MSGIAGLKKGKKIRPPELNVRRAAQGHHKGFLLIAAPIISRPPALRNPVFAELQGLFKVVKSSTPLVLSLSKDGASESDDGSTSSPPTGSTSSPPTDSPRSPPTDSPRSPPTDSPRSPPTDSSRLCNRPARNSGAIAFEIISFRHSRLCPLFPPLPVIPAKAGI